MGIPLFHLSYTTDDPTKDRTKHSSLRSGGVHRVKSVKTYKRTTRKMNRQQMNYKTLRLRCLRLRLPTCYQDTVNATNTI